MISARRAYAMALVWALGLTACDSSETVLLVDVDPGTMTQSPISISIAVYRTQQGARVPVGSSKDIAWTDALKGLGLKLKEDVTGDLSIEAAGNPSGVAGPVPVTVKAKETNGPIRLVFRDGTALPLDGGAIDGGPAAAEPDGGFGDGTALPLDGGITDGAPEAGVLDGALGDGTALPLDGDITDGAPGVGALDGALDAPEAVDGPESPLSSPDTAPDAADSAIRSTDAGENVDTAPDNAATPAFTSPQSIEPTAVLSDKPLVAVDPVREYVYVAWAQNRVIRVKRWSRASATWGVTQELRVEDSQPIYRSLRLAVDSAGRVYVAWLMGSVDSEQAVAGVWISQATPGEALNLSAPERIVVGKPDGLDMAIAGNGLVYLAYALEDPETAYNNIHASVFDGTTWKTYPEPLLATLSMEDPRISVAASGMGTAMVAFDKRVSGTRRTATFFLSGTTPTDTGYLDQTTPKGVSSRTLTMSGQGEAAMLWTREDTGDLYAAKYNVQAGWSTPVLVSYDAQDEPAVVMADDGTLTVAFGKREGDTYNLNVQSGKLSGTFGPATPLETDNKASGSRGTSDLSAPQMATDAAGNVLLVFHKKESDTTASLWGTRLESGSWRAPVLLARTDGLRVVFPAVGVASSGFGVYAFTYWEDVWPRTNALSDKAFVGFFQ